MNSFIETKLTAIARFVLYSIDIEISQANKRISILKIFFIVVILILFYCSTCHSQVWQKIYPDYSTNDIASIVHWKGDTLYAFGLNGTCLLSDDAGVTWKNLYVFRNEQQIYRAGSDGRNIYVIPYTFQFPQQDSIGIFNPASQTLTYMALDLGENARLIDLSVNNKIVVALATEEPWGVRKTLLFSSDLGLTWEKVNIPDSIFFYSGRQNGYIGFTSRENGIIVGLKKEGDVNARHVYVTNDGGVSWKRANINYSGKTYVYDPFYRYPISWINDTTAIVGYSHLFYKSSDAGETWKPMPRIPWEMKPEGEIMQAEFLPSGIGIVSGLFGETYKTTNSGNEWIRIRQVGRDEYQLHAICLADENHYVLGSLRGRMVRTSDGGISWDYMRNDYVRNIFLFKFSSETEGFMQIKNYYTRKREILQTSDAGKTWALSDEINKITNISDITRFDKDVIIITRSKSAGDSVLIWRSTNNGGDWTGVYVWPGVDSAITQCGQMSFIDNERGFVVTNKGLLKTTDGGKNWTWLENSYKAISSKKIYYIDFGNVQTGWMSTGNALYKTYDEGLSWEKVALPDGVTWIDELDAPDNKTVVIRSMVTWSIYYSSDEGATWEKMELKGFDYEWLDDKTSIATAPYVVLCTKDRWRTFTNTFLMYQIKAMTPGIYCYDKKTCWLYMTDGTIFLSRTGGVDGITKPSSDNLVYLDQNYPNPVRLESQSTTISYIVLDAGINDVEISIYNNLGIKAATLVNERVSQGRHYVKWNTSGVAPGLYFAVLKAGGIMQVKKIMVIR